MMIAFQDLLMALLSAVATCSLALHHTDQGQHRGAIAVNPKLTLTS
jgi:hypothetical protein